MAPRALPYNLGRGNAFLYNLPKFLNTSAARAHGTLRVAANVAQGETVSIGGTVFAVDQINTASGLTTANGVFNNTNATVRTVLAITNLAVGDYIAIGTELMRVRSFQEVADPTTGVDSLDVVLARGKGGTTIAAHANGVAINTSATPGAIVGAGHIVIPLTTALTPAAFIASFVAILNEHLEPISAKSAQFSAFSPAVNTLVVVARDVGAFTNVVLAETLAGAGNAWDTAAPIDGTPVQIQRRIAMSRAWTAAEVTATRLIIAHDFLANPSALIAQLRTAAGVNKAWAGAITYVAPVLDTSGLTVVIPGYITFAVDTAVATDVLHVLIAE